MKNFLHCSFIALCLLFVLPGKSQLAMTRSTFSGAYTPISLPSATLSTATGDDVSQNAVPLGFTFNYLGTNYTAISFSTNGVASFSPTIPTTATNSNLYNTTTPQLSLAPWWDNLLSDSILYELQGSSPNQTFTIQWTNSFSYNTVSTQQLNFQIVLHETTNEIEFMYGPVVSGTPSPNESASIGIEGATGGSGNYLDAVTGSAFTSNGMLSSTTKWPDHNYRFTPGAPAAIAAGTYTVGVSGNYFSLSEAIADINHRGITGAVTLSLIDANYDATPANGHNIFPILIGPVAGSSSTNTIMIQPASGTSTISYDGALNGNCGNQAATNVITNANEPVLGLVGATYVSVMDVNINSAATADVDRGIAVINSSATAGSQNNTFQDISITLNRNNAAFGIEQRAATTPTAATGANSNNAYYNLTISNVSYGVYLNGNANNPDANCIVGTTSSAIWNHIGSATADDILGTSTSAYGIRASNQNSVSLFNNEIRNLTQTVNNSNAVGIFVETGQGSINVHHNNIHDVKCSGTAGTGVFGGMRITIANTGTVTVHAYNNFISNITSEYTGAATATRTVYGFLLQNGGGGSNTSVIDLSFNSVRLDNSAYPNASSSCVEIGATNGPVINLRNNILANFTGAQAGAALHACIATPTTAAFGNTGSVSNNNDLYIANITNGYAGRGNTTNYATLANWQTAMTSDANSISANPTFNSATDLHVGAAALNAAADITGLTWVTDDIDFTPRAVTPDIGADEFAPLLIDAGIPVLNSPAVSGCHSSSEPVNVTLHNYAVIPLDFTSSPVDITVNVTGAVTQTLTFTVNNNSIYGGPLDPDSSIIVPVGTLNMSTAGTYMFQSYSTLTGDGNAFNDTNYTNVTFMPGAATSSLATVCGGSSITLSLSGSSAGGTIQWQSSTDGGMTWANETGTGNTTASYTTMPTDTTLYRVEFCGTLYSNIDTIMFLPSVAPVTVNDTICGIGNGTLTATGSGTIYWFNAISGGLPIGTGNNFTANVSSTTTFYAGTTTGTLTGTVGKLDNTGGGGNSGSANSLLFDVYQNCTLNGVYVYPAAAGNAIIDLVDSSGATLASSTFIVGAADVGQRTYVPLGFSLTPGINFTLQRNATSVQLYRNNAGAVYPYTLQGAVSITDNSANLAGYYYFFYDWQITYGCEGPRTAADIVVTTPPAITLSAGSTSLCSGNNTTLSMSSPNSNYTYTWSPAATLSSSTGSSVVATPTMSVTYTVNATDASSGCNAQDSVLINVTSLPVATASAVDTLVCTGQLDTLMFAFRVGLMDDSAGGNMSASANNLIFDVYNNCTLTGVYVYPNAAGNVIVELRDNANVLLNTATVAVSAADIGLKTWIPLNFNLTPGTGMQLIRNAASVQCWRNNIGVNYPYTAPGVLSITGSTAGPGFYYFFYDWRINQGPYSLSWSSIPVGFTATGDSVQVSPTVTTQYILTVTDTITGCTQTYSRTIDIATAVSASISGNTTICAGDSTTLVAMTTGGDGNLTYAWSNSDTNDSTTVMPATNTSYTVTVTDGCGSTSSANTTVTVNTPPVAGFTSGVSGIMTYDFTDASVGATSYSWDFGDASTSTASNPTHTYASIGTFTVTLIVTNSCGSDTLVQVLTVDGMNEISLANAVGIYPNPASGNVTLTANTTSAFMQIELFDLQGKLVKTEQVKNVTKGFVHNMNLETVPAGTYMLKVKTENGEQVMRLVVQ